MWWKSLVFVWFFLILQQGCFNPFVFTPDPQTMAQVNWWTSKAKHDAQATWRETEAEQWLRTHGFVNISRGVGGAPQVPQFHIVSGTKHTGAAEFSIDFLFGRDHTFEQVTSSTCFQ